MSEKQNADNERDEFSPVTLRELAGRSGYMCAFPGCRRLTVGPSDDRKSGLSMVGVGAHITAAAEGGPRYDKDLSPEERSGVGNGIWMCQTHGKLIDDNSSIHTSADLKRWKSQHEDWVFRRVANGPSHVRSGLTSIKLRGLGPFRQDSVLRLGRVTLILGNNGHGKTTLCEAMAAFSGEPLYGSFADRWRFGENATAYVEAATAEADVITTVRLTEVGPSYAKSDTLADEDEDEDEKEELAVINVPPRRVLVEVNGAVGPAWPTSRFPVVFLHDKVFGRTTPSFAEAVANIGRQFRLPEDAVWDALKDDFFVSSGYPCRFRRMGPRKIEIAIPDREFYLPPENLSHSEQCRIIIALVVRLCDMDRRATPWVLIVDTSFSSRLDKPGMKAMLALLAQNDENNLQTVICLTFEQDVAIAQSVLPDKWLGISTVGQLAAHTFL